MFTHVCCSRILSQNLHLGGIANSLELTSSKNELFLYRKQLDLLIETSKVERQKALKDLQPIFKRQQDLKVKAYLRD